jgi:TetR/AcrR family transcriptional regulator, tetracycline repressor protein
MALNRDEIVEAAARLLEQHGLEHLSLRKIAAELGVSAPTLLWHVGSKRELLDELAEHLMRGAGGARSRPAPDQHWTDWLVERSQAMFDAMTQHRDAPLIVAGNRPTPESLPLVEEMIGALVMSAGMSPGEALRTLFALTAYVGGSALEWQAEGRREQPSRVEIALHERVAEWPEFTNLHAAIDELHSHGHRATFEYGLALMVDGLRAGFPD